MHSDLENVLRSIRKSNAVYVPNGGNAGDSFIAHATYQLFARLGVEFELGHLSADYPGRVVIVGGGGNLVHPYPNIANFLRRNLGRWQQLVILPHTIRAYEETLRQLGPNCTLFCRERPSFDFVAGVSPRATVLLSHDLALSCDFDDTRRLMADRRVRDLLDPTLLVRNTKRLVRKVRHGLATGGSDRVLDAFRTDVEGTAGDVPGTNIDLSEAFAADDMSPASSLHATFWTMSFVDRFEVVRTNRLHIGIMAAMLGKQLELFDNSYGKVRDVFDHSLRDRFPNVRWQGELGAGLAAAGRPG
jgi:exopolysaccharide biosynthesis predicted pyruvyltransferase EpsI